MRAARILGQLDVLYAPAGRKGGDSRRSPSYASTGAHTEVRCCHFPMSADSAEKEAVWNDVAAALAREVAAGRQVGFITLGDAMLFSTGLSAAADWLPGLAGDCPRRYLLRRHCRAGENPAGHGAAVAGGDLLHRAGSGHCRALRQHDSLVLMKVYGRFARIKALLAQAGLLDAALMMSEATLPGEQCWRRLREVSDDQPLPYFSTIRLTNSGRRRNESGEIAEAAFVWGWRPLFC